MATRASHLPAGCGRVLVILLGMLLWYGGLPEGALAISSEKLEARIISVEPDPEREELLRIVGTAAGQDFSGYVLESGEGEFPQEWTELVRSNRPVVDGLMARWQTGRLSSAAYALRLIVRDAGGTSLRDRVVVRLQDLRPDLAAGVLAVRFEDHALRVSVAVANPSPQPLRKKAWVDFYLAQHPDSPSIHLGRKMLPLLAPSAQSSLEATLEISSQIPEGAYTILAILDPAGEVVEAQEDNNRSVSANPIMMAPDLTITGLQGILLDGGRRARVSGTLANQGNRPARGPFSVSVYLSQDGVIGAGDFKMADRKFSGLDAHRSLPFEMESLLPASLSAGSYFVLGEVDSEGRIFEEDDSNNVHWAGRLTLGPDVVISDLSVSATAGRGEIIISETLKNESPYYGVAQPFRVTYRLAKADSPEDSVRILGDREVRPLGPGKAATARLPFEVGSFPAERYVIWAEADSAEGIAEMARGNNRKMSDPFEIRPDLAIHELRAVLTPRGDQAEISDRVVNQGNLAVGRPFSVGYYLSDDERPDSRDHWLGQRVISGLDAGSDSAGRTLVPIGPAAAAAGAFILAWVDPRQEVNEVVLDNNVASAGRILQQDVDLVLSHLSAEPEAEGQRLRLRHTVQNLGSRDVTRPFTLAFYLSDDGAIGPGDLLIGQHQIDRLGAQESASGELVLTPTHQEKMMGALSVLGRVDSQNEITERREDNNDSWGSSLRFGPDLHIARLTGEVSSDAREIVVTGVVENRGNRPVAGPYSIGIALIGGPGDGPQGRLLGSHPMTPLAAGGSINLNFSVPMNESVLSGRHVILARVDPDESIWEVDESNNEYRGGELLIGPDLVIEALESALTGEEKEIIIEDKVRNRGNRPATGGLEVEYYLSRNWVIDDSDTRIGSRLIDYLAPDESSAARTLHPIPSKGLATGRYFLMARIRGGAQVMESDITNNIRPTVLPIDIRQGRKR